ncbi:MULTISPECIES: hypothetical protein [Sutterella]|uniref:hypothetical protein n=1 Tax=Sutterella TaxID=40544 RepID=UPI0011C6EF7A|nr:MULTISPECIES: hypothetical protein [Sutterella]MDR3927051.1 hypothetical protein [Sutterella sp.]
MQQVKIKKRVLLHQPTAEGVFRANCPPKTDDLRLAAERQHRYGTMAADQSALGRKNAQMTLNSFEIKRLSSEIDVRAVMFWHFDCCVSSNFFDGDPRNFQYPSGST